MNREKLKTELEALQTIEGLGSDFTDVKMKYRSSMYLDEAEGHPGYYTLELRTDNKEVKQCYTFLPKVFTKEEFQECYQKHEAILPPLPNDPFPIYITVLDTTEGEDIFGD